jgi:hypothetical protein
MCEFTPRYDDNQDNVDWLKNLIYGEPVQEDLCEELERSKVQVDGKWSLKHRLIVEPYYDPANNPKFRD